MQEIENSVDQGSGALSPVALFDASTQHQWEVSEGAGSWRWCPDGLHFKGDGTEWSAFGWEFWKDRVPADTNNFVIEVTVSGKAEAAGLSFGPYKDFLTSLDSTMPPRRLQLEVDGNAGCWVFRVDGELMDREWWDAKVTSVDDLLSGTLSLKAKNGSKVLFQDLRLHPLRASCRLSVIMTCNRFLQRLRISLRNWCYQDLPSGAYEVLIVNPQSPDGTHEHIAAVARSFPHVRLREIAVGSDLLTNKGAMINRAFACSSGEWIWLTDADCLFAPHCAGAVLRGIENRPNHLFYGQRRFLPAAQTDALLAGRVDGLHDFAELTDSANMRPPESAPWGYTQIVHRDTFARFRYREGVNHYALSDFIFIEDCKRHGFSPQQIDGLFCLHMDHPFSWYGTQLFL
jgi:hypothetical protein